MLSARTASLLGRPQAGRAFALGRLLELDEERMRRRGTDVLATMRLRVEPANQARFQRDVALFARFADQASLEPTQGDHDAVWVVVRIRLLPGFISVVEHPYTRVFEDDLVLVGVGLCGIGHGLLLSSSSCEPVYSVTAIF